MIEETISPLARLHHFHRLPAIFMQINRVTGVDEPRLTTDAAAP